MAFRRLRRSSKRTAALFFLGSDACEAEAEFVKRALFSRISSDLREMRRTGKLVFLL